MYFPPDLDAARKELQRHAAPLPEGEYPEHLKAFDNLAARLAQHAVDRFSERHRTVALPLDVWNALRNQIVSDVNNLLYCLAHSDRPRPYLCEVCHHTFPNALALDSHLQAARQREEVGGEHLPGISLVSID